MRKRIISTIVSLAAVGGVLGVGGNPAEAAVTNKTVKVCRIVSVGGGYYATVCELVPVQIPD